MNCRELFWLFLILLLSFTFRFISAGLPVLNGDEGDLVDSVLELEKEISPWQRWAGLLPPMATWTSAVFMQVFGFEEWAVRLYGAVFGTLTVGVIFFLAKLHFGTRTAIISAAYAAVMPLLVLSNRDAHPDNVLIFFSLLAILLWEYSSSIHLKPSWQLAIAVLGGISAGLAVGSKYNSVALFGLYWLFQLVTEFRMSFKKLISSVLAALFIMVLLLQFNIQNAVYFFHGILYWMFNQSLTITVPWYYSFSVLFDGLSPLVFFLLPIGILLIKKNRHAYLHIVLCIAFIALVTLQARKFPRHFLMAMPFAAIIFGNLVASVRKNTACIILATILIIGAAGWSLYKSMPYESHTTLRDVGKIILTNSEKNATVFIDGIEYWPAKYYTKYQRRVVARLEIQLLKEGDIVIVHQLNSQTPFLIGSPLQNDLTLYLPKYADQYKWNYEFNEYALTQGTILAKLPYDSMGNAITVVKITHNNSTFKEQKRQLDTFTARVCDMWFSQNIVADAMKLLLPQQIKQQVNQKCTKGCVVTCDIM